MELKLLVIRTAHMEQLVKLYSIFGLTFEYHKHGNSPMHYAATIGQTILEIYPLAKTQEAADVHLRLGFGIDDFENAMHQLRQLETPFIQEPSQTEFGFMTIIADTDGRKIELYKKMEGHSI